MGSYVIPRILLLRSTIAYMEENPHQFLNPYMDLIDSKVSEIWLLPPALMRILQARKHYRFDSEEPCVILYNAANSSSIYVYGVITG